MQRPPFALQRFSTMRIRTHRYSSHPSSSSAMDQTHQHTPAESLLPMEIKAEQSGAVTNVACPHHPDQVYKSVANRKEPEVFRACTLNRSPWDVPRFFRAFERQCTNPIAPNSAKPNKQQQQNHKYSAPLTKSTRMETEHSAKELNNEMDATRSHCFSTSTAQCEEEQAKGRAMESLSEENPGREEQLLASALQKVLSEAGDDGLTVREAGCKLLQLRNKEEFKSMLGGLENKLPLSVQVRRAMLSSPYIVELDDGRFALCNAFLNKQRAVENNSERPGIANEEQRANNIDEEGPQNKEVKHLALSNLTQSKGKRSIRAGMIERGMKETKETEVMVMGICRRGRPRRWELDQTAEGGFPSCEQHVNKMRSYHTKCSIEDIIGANECYWDTSSDSLYYYYTGFGPCFRSSGCSRNEDGYNCKKASESFRKDLPKKRHAAPSLETLSESCLPSRPSSFSSYNVVGHPPQRRKAVKARSLKSML